MEKKQSDLYQETLRRLSKAGVLPHLILIGSWCLPLYQRVYFKNKPLPAIRTRDLDFLVPHPGKLKIKIDVPELLKDMGFIKDFISSKGYIRLVHPDLFVEFLVEEKGRGSDGPYPLPQLGLNAQPLRFLNFLTENTISMNVDGLKVTVPHPANYALHKLIISARRSSPEKKLKDKESALSILEILVENGEADVLKEIFNSAPIKWQKKILNVLRDEKQQEVVEILNS